MIFFLIVEDSKTVSYYIQMVRPWVWPLLVVVLSESAQAFISPLSLFSPSTAARRACLTPRISIADKQTTTTRIATPAPFTGDFTKPASIPEEGIKAAVEVMRSGRLFRYAATSPEESQVSAVELEFAQLVQSKYAVGVNSCGSAIMLALKAVGVQAGDKVLTNAFTFTAVPSALPAVCLVSNRDVARCTSFPPRTPLSYILPPFFCRCHRQTKC